MANEQQESLGRTFFRGMVWGAGFALVSVPIGIVLHRWLDPTDDDDDDDDDDGPWHEFGMTRSEYRDYLAEIQDEKRREKYGDEED